MTLTFLLSICTASALSITPADVTFIQGMIIHHQQAIDMSELVGTRTTSPDIRLIAERIVVSQNDETKSMRRWLTAHHQPTMDMPMMMPGMLTPEQMKTLASAKGETFDRLYLEGMIQHHEGALKMVADLFATKGAAQETAMFTFATDVDSDQRDEIARMRSILASHRL